MDYLISDKLRQELTRREQFIIMYKAALKVGLSREQLAGYIDGAVDSIRRKRSKIEHATGLNLPLLELTGKSAISAKLLGEFEAEMEQLKDSQAPIRIDEYECNRRYVIASAQNATPVNEDFLSAILNYCDINDAELKIIPVRYRNPTSLWSDIQEGDEWWHPDILDYIDTSARLLGKSLEYMGHIKIQPTAVTPLTGYEDITGLRSGIFGHPRIELKSIATPSASLPKILTTTGTVTHRNYTDSKAGHKGAFHHSFAALIVEIDGNGHHHLRHIHWNEKLKRFYDLDSFYTSSSSTSGIRALGLITGDTHAEFIDKMVEKATYIGPNSLCGRLNPVHVVWHDVEDFYPRNHHHRGNDLLSYAKQHFGRNNVEAGLQRTADFVDMYSHPDRKNIIVKSNHDEAFDRWLGEVNPKLDAENMKFYHYMKYHQLDNVSMTATGFESFDPFAWWCSNPCDERGLESAESTVFLKRDESYEIAGIEVGFHGDVGTNGTRASIVSFSKIGPKVVIGHSHSPGIRSGAYQVGLSARLNLEYKSGPSSWMHTHCIIYEDGSRTLIHIIDGEYTTMK